VPLLLKVLHAETTPLTFDDTGKIVNGFIRVCGAIHSIFVRCESQSPKEADYRALVSMNNSNTLRLISGYVFLDVLPEGFHEKYYCISLFTRSHDLISLLLRYEGYNSNLSTHQYTRQGLLEFKNTNSFMNPTSSSSDALLDVTDRFTEFYYDPDIPCDMYDKEQGYTITII
jgi:hypothetical protein